MNLELTFIQPFEKISRIHKWIISLKKFEMKVSHKTLLHFTEVKLGEKKQKLRMPHQKIKL